MTRPSPEPDQTDVGSRGGARTRRAVSPPSGMGPAVEPIGRQLARTAKTVSRAFDEALSRAGGSLPDWLILLALRGRQHGMQRELAEALGIEGPTLTHHLNRMESAGLVTRRRDPDNRRVHRVELTTDGEAAFRRLLGTVTGFDRRLRSGLTDGEIDTLSGLLARLSANVTTSPEGEASGP